MKRNSGYSLISVLVVTAIGGVLAVAIMALIDNMSRVMVRANVAGVVEHTIGTVASILGNAEYCDNSLRGAGPGDKLVYNVQDNPVGPPPGGNEIEIQNIFAQEVDNTPGATAVISTVAGNPLSFLGGGSRVQSIRFRERSRGVGRGRVQKDGLMFDSYAGEIELMINAPGGTIVRVIPLTVIVDETTRVIEGCYVRDRTIQALCNSMGGTFDPANGSCREMINPVTVDCQGVCSGLAAPYMPGSQYPDAPVNPPRRGGYCARVCDDTGAGSSLEKAVPVYHLLGFRTISHAGGPDGAATSAPICACTTVIYNTPSPPPVVTPTPTPPPPPRPPPPPPSN